MSENPDTVSPLDSATDSARVEPVANTGRGQSVLGRLAGMVPNLIVLFALGVLGFWGQQTDWKLPKFAALTGSGATDKGDWCDEHGIPESVCVLCNPELLPPRPAFGWCGAHGVFDCPWEHPEVAQLQNAPIPTPVDLECARRALATPRPTNSSECEHHGQVLQFGSEEAIAKAGLEFKAAKRGAITETITANGEVGYDPRRVAQLSTPVTGRVWKVYKELGQPVAAGEVLALVNSSEVSKAKTEFRSALAQLGLAVRDVARIKPLAGKSVAEAELLKAEAAQEQAQIRLADARQALANLGLLIDTKVDWRTPPESVTEHLHSLGLESLPGGLDKTAPEGLIPVTATRAGAVVARKAVEGDLVDPAKTLFVVADTSRMTITLNVRQEDARLLRARDEQRRIAGQEVRFRGEGTEEEVVGEVAWISPAADEITRAVPVRAEVANPDGQLRAGTFGAGQIVLRAEKQAVLVPSEAVQWEGDAFVVFVRDKNFQEPGGLKVFHTRVVRPGAKESGNTEIVAGLLPGEFVVTKGSGVLRSELLKNDLGGD